MRSGRTADLRFVGELLRRTEHHDEEENKQTHGRSGQIPHALGERHGGENMREKAGEASGGPWEVVTVFPLSK